MKLDLQRFADGKVVIDTDLNDSGFKKGLDKMQSIASTGFKAIAGTVGVASTAITGLVAKSVTAAGELEQQIGGSQAVFKSLGETIDDIKFKTFEDGEGQMMSLRDVANDAFQTMGLSANDYMATLNKMGALMQGSGVDAQESLDLAGQAMQRAADVASIMGIDINSAMDSIAGAAKGNFTMMDNLGVAMNATTIEAYAMSKGIGTAYNEMDNATKIGLAMEMFLEKTEYATGNYVKENQTFAGSFSTLKAAIGNFLSGSGGIQDVTKALVSFGKVLVKSIKEMAPKVVSGLVELVKAITPEITPLLQSLLPEVITGATELINGLIEIFPAILQLIEDNLPIIIDGAILIIQTLITTFVNMAPKIYEMGITLLIELTKGIVKALPELIPVITKVVLDIVNILLDHIDEIIEMGIQILIALIDGIINALPELVVRLPEIIIKIVATLINLLPEIIAVGIRIIGALITGLFRALPELIIRIPELILRMVNGLLEGVKDFANVGVNLVKGLWEGISGSMNWIKNKISGWVGNVVDFIKGMFGVQSPSTVMRDEVGKYLAQGMGVGFDNELDDVYRDMQRAIDFETSKLSANVESSGTYQMAMAGLPTFNLQDNSENTTQLVVDGKVLAEVVNTENRNREVARA